MTIDRYRPLSHAERIRRIREDSHHRRVDVVDTPELRAVIAAQGVVAAARHVSVANSVISMIVDRMLTDIVLPESTPEETWRWVPGHTGYACVSDGGNVQVARRHPGRNGHHGTTGTLVPAHQCRYTPKPTGNRKSKSYCTVTLRAKIYRVHVLVLLAFVGPRENYWQQGCHRNDNSLDNRLTNLRWDTPRNNCLDCARNNGSRHASFEVIRAIYVANGSNGEIASSFGVPRHFVAEIRRPHTWTELTKDLVRGDAAAPRSSRRKMPDALVAEARRAAASGEAIRAIARRMRVCPSGLKGAIRGQTWKEMTDPPPVPGKPFNQVCKTPVVPGGCRVQKAATYRIPFPSHGPTSEEV